MKHIPRRFLVLPGAEITWGFDFTGMVLLQYGDNWLEDPRVKNSYVLSQPEKDINGKRCATGGNVSIDRKYLSEVFLE